MRGVSCVCDASHVVRSTTIVSTCGLSILDECLLGCWVCGTVGAPGTSSPVRERRRWRQAPLVDRLGGGGRCLRTVASARPGWLPPVPGWLPLAPGHLSAGRWRSGAGPPCAGGDGWRRAAGHRVAVSDGTPAACAPARRRRGGGPLGGRIARDSLHTPAPAPRSAPRRRDPRCARRAGAPASRPGGPPPRSACS